MLFQQETPQDKRQKFRENLKSGKLLRFPGAFSPIISMMIERQGFDGIYISGAVLSNDLGMPDIGMTTLTEVSQRAKQISQTSSLPSIVDIDTGFGEAMSAARTIKELELLGLSGCHLEDQENPKRCGHLDHKNIVSIKDMQRKIKAAAQAKTDPHFLIIARTDARASEGLEKAIDRAKAYIDAGAEMIFPEALKDEKEFEAFRENINVPLMANMTEFGKSPILDKTSLENLGYNLVIYPVTLLRLALKTVEKALQNIDDDGSQLNIIDQMLTRKELYDLIEYEKHNSFDQKIYNFDI